jgi:hypothetical protein
VIPPARQDRRHSLRKSLFEAPPPPQRQPQPQVKFSHSTFSSVATPTAPTAPTLSVLALSTPVKPATPAKPYTPTIHPKKIDAKGNYLRFPGTSIISFLANPADPPRREVWPPKQIDFDGLRSWIIATQKIFTSCYSLLPVSSYHMTVKNHSVASSCASESDWFDGVLLHFAKYQQIKDMCLTHARSTTNVKTKVTSPYFVNCFGIDLAIDPQHLHAVEHLRTQLVFAGSPSEPNFRFHVTLGYRFREPGDAQEQQALDKEINAISIMLKTILTQVDFVLEFQSPRLCYFQNMMSFSPM